ncbi:hypothetical protein AWC35_21825 [Gibbsiella quercinecans]|uniref:Uncharacterized protein n=1 Tax=Gibbsiella quercinecans TaxID=929813 RepID=A0A250B698_9GAMM|nr:hypothetical protein AWC35_21825 [Gibbsiella quercinecans]RLM03796.1 hypothetical protein BIY30_21745 [Gibbsiella quercinecans]
MAMLPGMTRSLSGCQMLKWNVGAQTIDIQEKVWVVCMVQTLGKQLLLKLMHRKLIYLLVS